MEEELYDEFGNYIGPELNESDDEELPDHDFPENDMEEDAYNPSGNSMQISEYNPETRIILNEDKKYYLDADEVYPGTFLIFSYFNDLYFIFAIN